MMLIFNFLNIFSCYFQWWSSWMHKNFVEMLNHKFKVKLCSVLVYCVYVYYSTSFSIYSYTYIFLYAPVLVYIYTKKNLFGLYGGVLILFIFIIFAHLILDLTLLWVVVPVISTKDVFFAYFWQFIAMTFDIFQFIFPGLTNCDSSRQCTEH